MGHFTCPGMCRYVYRYVVLGLIYLSVCVCLCVLFVVLFISRSTFLRSGRSIVTGLPLDRTSPLSLIHRPRRMTVPFLRQLYYPVCTSWMKAYLTIVLYCVSPIRIGNTIVSTTTTVCSMGFPIRKREVYLYAVSTLRKGRKR